VSDREQKIIDFNKIAKHPINVKLNLEDLRLSLRLIKEEFIELQEIALDISSNFTNQKEITTEQKTNLLKELGDLQYVVSRMAVVFGINLQEVFDRIHKSNMTKVEKGVTRDPTTGKILKGPNYKEPNLKDLVDG
tara:strand:+ start:7491 stop:7895 length:405 start_codon:yes stop_codon:yes gene_type:complete